VGFTAPMIRKPVRVIVLLNAMIPRPGESPNDWWGDTGSSSARREADLAAGRDPEFEPNRHFFHDLPRRQSGAVIRRGARPLSGGDGAALRLREWAGSSNKSTDRTR